VNEISRRSNCTVSQIVECFAQLLQGLDKIIKKLQLRY